jgi:hypothetical protein
LSVLGAYSVVLLERRKKKQRPRCKPSIHRIHNQHLQLVFCVEPKERQCSVIYWNIPLGIWSVLLLPCRLIMLVASLPEDGGIVAVREGVVTTTTTTSSALLFCSSPVEAKKEKKAQVQPKYSQDTQPTLTACVLRGAQRTTIQCCLLQCSS